MPKLPVIKAKELVRAVERLGFEKRNQVGSHAQYKHTDGRRTTIPIHAGKDIGRKTLKSIIDDLDMTVDEFISILKK